MNAVNTAYSSTVAPGPHGCRPRHTQACRTVMRKNVSALGACSGLVTLARTCMSHDTAPQEFRNDLTTRTEAPLYLHGGLWDDNSKKFYKNVMSSQINIYLASANETQHPSTREELIIGKHFLRCTCRSCVCV